MKMHVNATPIFIINFLCLSQNIILIYIYFFLFVYVNFCITNKLLIPTVFVFLLLQ